jgi:hypothetical protein
MRSNVVTVVSKKVNSLRLLVSTLVLAVTPFFDLAARASSDDVKAAGGCAVCGGGLATMIILPVIIQVAFLAWVVKDARARGIESPLGWMVFVFFVPLVGILVYWFSRPPLKA